MARTRTWSTTIPVDHTQIKNLPDSTRDVREDIEERVDGILAGFVNTGATNGLLLGRLLTVGTNNALTPGTGTSGAYDIYAMTTGSTIELFGKDNTGKVTQLSDAGKQTFKTGDWILSSVTTARTGWTNVSATYANKFIRLSATPLTTGGADTHTHAAAVSGNTAADLAAHTHTQNFSASTSGSGYVNAANANTHLDSGIVGTTNSTGAGGGHTHTIGETASGNNVPAYVQAVIFQKD